MKKIITFSFLLNALAPIKSEDWINFLVQKRWEKEDANKSNFSQDDDIKQDFSSSEVSSRKNIESVIPVKYSRRMGI